MNPGRLGNFVLRIRVFGVDRVKKCGEMALKDVVVWEQLAEGLGVLLEDKVRRSGRKRL
jgi:hypothetical protein